MRKTIWTSLSAPLLALGALGAGPAPHASTFAVTVPATQAATPLDGRLILLLAKGGEGEPREQVAPQTALQSPFMFGRDVDALAPGGTAVVDTAAFGWPVADLSAMPAGDYVAQAVLNRYETFHRADGSVVKLAPDRGEGQNWTKKPGNLYSAPVKVHLDPAHPQRIALTLDRTMPAIADKPDTDYVKHVRIQSALLTAFWGRPTYLRAHVLLPEGFAAHPKAHYPLMVFHGHFPDDISEFRTTPPDPDLKPVYSERFHLAGYNRIEQQEAYDSIASGSARASRVSS